MNKNYQIEDSIIVTDWMQKPDLFPIDNNFDKILKGFLETAGRVSQPSYNFYVMFFKNSMIQKLSYIVKYVLFCLNRYLTSCLVTYSQQTNPFQKTRESICYHLIL